MTIDVLPDDALVDIFDFYINWDPYTPPNKWRALVHVCRRWRYLVFASPRHLNLRLAYLGRRPMPDALGVWPVMPVILLSTFEVLLRGVPYSESVRRWDNLVAALESEHYHHISEIDISEGFSLRWGRFAAAMQKPFPELTHLRVSLYGSRDLVPVLPDSFLGGSVPHLRTLELRSIPFPSMPKLLLSANGLVKITLLDIPNSGYISPDAMATALTMMTRLESLHLQFRSPRSFPNTTSQHLPPSARFVLPALTKLVFRGIYEYLEDLLARIDAPLLYYLRIIFFKDLDFDVPQLRRLIGHAEGFKAFDHAEVVVFHGSIRLSLVPKTGAVDRQRQLAIEINCAELDLRLSSLAQLCSSPLPLIATLEELKITESKYLSSSHWKCNTDDTRWVELLDSFTAVKNLYLTDEIARHVCGALRELSRERVTEVLPSLQNVFVDGSRSFEQIEEAMRPFVAARQLSGRPVAIDHWRR